MSLSVGTRLGQYNVTSLLGEGRERLGGAWGRRPDGLK